MSTRSGIHGYWIWTRDEGVSDTRVADSYNVAARFRKVFTTAPGVSGYLKITADSWYRAWVNGRLVSDGPARSWPEHYSYDILDLSPYLRPGKNTVETLVRYFGTGTFHGIPQRPGFLAEIAVENPDEEILICTDRTWEAMPCPALVRNTPKISIQMEPFELYDGRLEGSADWAPAVELCGVVEGPWKDLRPRDVGLLTTEPVVGRSILTPTAVASDGEFFSFPAARMVNPGLIEANNNTALPLGLAVIIESQDRKQLRFTSNGLKIFVNGTEVVHAEGEGTLVEGTGEYAPVDLRQGENFILLLPVRIHGHYKDWSIGVFDGDPSVPHLWKSPTHTQPSHERGCSWSGFVLSELRYNGDDMIFMFHADPARDDRERKAAVSFLEIAKNVYERSLYLSLLERDEVETISRVIVTGDPHYRFMCRRPLVDTDESAPVLTDPKMLLYDTPACAFLEPAHTGDTEFMIDFGTQRCGYYEFELFAPEGTVIDVFGIEYIDEGGRLQHTLGNRNGLRYVCRQGWNVFTSLKRRSGRYVFVTVRNCNEPVQIRRISLRESMYPANEIGSFRCSDAVLQRIYEMSVHTLRLCMEDTYTDCPLYEQTLWVGDARNEALYALSQFGAADITRRCLRLAAESLERYEIVGCQVPSSWDCLLPAWSFMWGISVEEYFLWSGDREFLREVWPWVIRNLRGAWRMRDERGLFSGPYWNMFDWSRSDFQHRTVLHNSMFFIGALDSAVRCAEFLGEEDAAVEFRRYRQNLAEAVEAVWDEERRAYPDSLHADGTMSPVSSVHTAALALLYEIAGSERQERLIEYLVEPPDGMVPISSPFAMQYLFEALEAVELQERVIEAIREYYAPMIVAGSTTVWEVLPISKDHPDGFPTRSHCHAWSASPAYYLPRIVLGIRPVEVGCRRVIISPCPCGLEWAQGSVATPLGAVTVTWKIQGKEMHIRATVPTGVEACIEPNDAWRDFKVTIDGHEVTE